MIKFTHFDVLREPFVDLEQASRRMPKIVQNYAKMQLKSSQNEHEKTCAPVSQWPKTHVVAGLRKYIKTRSFLSFPVLLCSRHECKNHSKSSKIIDGVCKVSTVVPAARRANSKCIFSLKHFQTLYIVIKTLPDSIYCH